LGNVTAIVVGVIIASIGEIKFVMIGFVCAMLGVAFEATRLAMVERLLSSAEFKMDPMVTLYYFAPVCAIMNGCVALFLEIPSLSMAQVYDLGLFTLLANASIAFCLNLSVVFLVRFHRVSFVFDSNHRI
jgi:Triose-phosphate Transporter family